MLDPGVAAAFQHVQKSVHVVLGVGVRIGDGVPHAGLRREVHHARRAPLLEHPAHRLGVGDVDAHEREALAVQARQPRFLQRGVVVRVEIVEAEDLVAAIEQPARHVVADEPGGARHQDHRCAPPPDLPTSRRRRWISAVSCSYSWSFRWRKAEVT